MCPHRWICCSVCSNLYLLDNSYVWDFTYLPFVWVSLSPPSEIAFVASYIMSLFCFRGITFPSLGLVDGCAQPVSVSCQAMGIWGLEAWDGASDGDWVCLARRWSAQCTPQGSPAGSLASCGPSTRMVAFVFNELLCHHVDWLVGVHGTDVVTLMQEGYVTKNAMSSLYSHRVQKQKFMQCGLS